MVATPPTPEQTPENVNPISTGQLRREIQNLDSLFNVRIDGVEKAIQIFNDNLTRVPTDTDKQISHLREYVVAKLENVSEVHDERFRSIAVQFLERDTRTEQTSRDSKVAVDAALQAAKEAVGEQNKSSALAIAKSEAATTKQIDQMGTLVQNSTAGLNDKIDDIKQRLTSIEGKGLGERSNTQNNYQVITMVIAAFAIFTTICIAIFVTERQPQQTVGIDSKRVDDLNSRINELGAKLNNPPVVITK